MRIRILILNRYLTCVDSLALKLVVLGAWKCNFPAFLVYYDRPCPTTGGPANKPTNRRTCGKLHFQITCRVFRATRRSTRSSPAAPFPSPGKKRSSRLGSSRYLLTAELEVGLLLVQRSPKKEKKAFRSVWQKWSFVMPPTLAMPLRKKETLLRIAHFQRNNIKDVISFFSRDDLYYSLSGSHYLLVSRIKLVRSDWYIFLGSRELILY